MSHKLPKLTSRIAHAPIPSPKNPKPPKPTTTDLSDPNAPPPLNPPCSVPIQVLTASENAPGLRLISDRHTALTPEQADAWRKAVAVLFSTSNFFRWDCTRNIVRKCASTLLNAPQWEAVEYGWGLEEPVVVRMEEECHCEDAKAVELLPDQPNLSGMSKEEKKAFMRKERILRNCTAGQLINKLTQLSLQRRAEPPPTQEEEKEANWEFQCIMREYFAHNPTPNRDALRIINTIYDWFNVRCTGEMCWMKKAQFRYLFSFPTRTKMFDKAGNQTETFAQITHNLLITAQVATVRATQGDEGVNDFLDQLAHYYTTANPSTDPSLPSQSLPPTLTTIHKASGFHPPDEEIMKQRNTAAHDRRLIEAVYDMRAFCKARLRKVSGLRKEVKGGILVGFEGCKKIKGEMKGTRRGAVEWGWQEALDAVMKVERGSKGEYGKEN